jgi:hypothetical protein
MHPKTRQDVIQVENALFSDGDDGPLWHGNQPRQTKEYDAGGRSRVQAGGNGPTDAGSKVAPSGYVRTQLIEPTVYLVASRSCLRPTIRVKLLQRQAMATA